MLISGKMNTIIQVLLTTNSKSINEISKKADLTPAMASRILKRLQDSEYIAITPNNVKVVDKSRLLKAWGYSYTIRELPKVEFLGAGRPQFVMEKIINIAQKLNLTYAFTLFSATESIYPHVLPSVTHLYINIEDSDKWKEAFLKENILPIGKNGNVTCILVNKDFFENNIISFKDSNKRTVSLERLYADLISFGGMGEEAGQFIDKIIRDIDKHSE